MPGNFLIVGMLAKKAVSGLSASKSGGPDSGGLSASRPPRAFVDSDIVAMTAEGSDMATMMAVTRGGPNSMTTLSRDHS